MKKLFKVFLCLLIVISYYAPFMPFTTIVKAESTYTFAISYPDADVVVESNLTYADALKKMNEYQSTEIAVGVIKNSSNKIVNAAYAIAETDYVSNKKLDTTGEGMKYLCSSASQAAGCTSNSSSYLTYYGSTWGTDAAFLDYNLTYDAVKIKISGLVGYLPLSSVNLVPVSKFYEIYNSHYNMDAYKMTNYPKVKNNVQLNVRDKASTEGEILTTLASGGTYEYYPSKSTTTTEDGCTWFYIKYTDTKKGYVCNKDDYLTLSNTMLNDTYYYSNGNVLYFQVHQGKKFPESNFKLGTAPFYYTETAKKYYLTNSSKSGLKVEQNKRYYSFDGNYFYKYYSDMIDDYRSNSHSKAINKDNPYYPYFTYLPAHSISGYTANQINQFVINAGFTGFPTNPASYIDPKTGAWIKTKPTNLSMMYGIGPAIINAQNTYGVNALTIYSAAASESATGTSAIAFAKNNLFGMGAVDASPFTSAVTYSTVAESVNAYAASVSKSTFGNIYAWQYYGTHLGNKLSGQAVMYASDPYSGYSKAMIAYAKDEKSGHIDEFSNTIGVTNNTKSTVKIYSEPSTSSPVIYETKNYNNNKILTNMPFILTELVEKNGVKFYKVYSDVALTSSRTMTTSSVKSTYSMKNSYGYIKASDLNVSNSAPVIVVNTTSIEQYDETDPVKFVTATDREDDIDKKEIEITYTGEYNPNKAGDYVLTFTATDSSRLSSSVTSTITVEPTSAPDILADDIEVPLYKSFDPKTGVSVIDKEDGDITDAVVIVGSINTNEMGVYTYTYTSTDSDGNVSSKTRKVTVVANEKPVINAVNKIVLINTNYDYLSGVSATDKEDGDVSSSIKYNSNLDITKEGIYSVTYTAKDLDNQESEKTISVTVEAKKYTSKTGSFYMHNLKYNSANKTLDFTGYLVITGMNNKKTDVITYDILFENQSNGDIYSKSLSRMISNMPFQISLDSKYDYTGAWFNEQLNIKYIPSGNYTVYVRARKGDYESKVLLTNAYFRTDVVRKFNIDGKGFMFRINYFNRELPLELFVREDGLLSSVDSPTIDNMYNQVYSIDVTKDGVLNLKASSHTVKGNYASGQSISRWVSLENTSTMKIAKTVSVGSITNGPYKISLSVSDGYDKTRAWYNTSIDLTTLPNGKYSINVRTKTGSIDDFGELYDITFMNLNKTVTVNGKKITISRNNQLRYRIEITVENA